MCHRQMLEELEPHKKLLYRQIFEFCASLFGNNKASVMKAVKILLFQSFGNQVDKYGGGTIQILYTTKGTQAIIRQK